jgi:hypothetical protein
MEINLSPLVIWITHGGARGPEEGGMGVIVAVVIVTNIALVVVAVIHCLMLIYITFDLVVLTMPTSAGGYENPKHIE